MRLPVCGKETAMGPELVIPVSSLFPTMVGSKNILRQQPGRYVIPSRTQGRRRDRNSTPRQENETRAEKHKGGKMAEEDRNWMNCRIPEALLESSTWPLLKPRALASVSLLLQIITSSSTRCRGAGEGRNAWGWDKTEDSHSQPSQVKKPTLSQDLRTALWYTVLLALWYLRHAEAGTRTYYLLEQHLWQHACQVQATASYARNTALW